MPSRQSALRIALCSGAALVLVSGTASFAQDTAAGPPPGEAAGAMPLGPDGQPMAPPPGGGFQALKPENVGVYIKDGAYDKSRSTPAVSQGAAVSDRTISGLKVNSSQEKFNAVYVSGAKSNVTLSDSTLTLTGHGGDDVSGIGAAVLVGDGGTLSLHNVYIETSAAVASAAVSTGKSTLRVFNSTLITHGGPLPADYKPHIGPGMMEAPPPLKITGTARASNTTFGASSYYYNSRIISDGWGAFSTDGGGKYAECNRCYLETIKSGYGAYADGGIEVVLNDSDINTATYTAIIAGSGKMTLNNSRGVSRGDGVMIHNVMGSPVEIGRLNIHGGQLKTVRDGILVKSANAIITLDGARIEPGSGTIIHAIVNDDANATKATKESPGNHAIILNSQLTGDLVNDDTQHMMDATFIDSALKGRIHHVAIALSGKSHWTATKDSDVMLIGMTTTAGLDAAAGVKIEAVTGDGTTLKGTYKLRSGGTLVLVAPPAMAAQ